MRATDMDDLTQALLDLTTDLSNAFNTYKEN